MNCAKGEAGVERRIRLKMRVVKISGERIASGEMKQERRGGEIGVEVTASELGRTERR